ncbi:nuclear transport factor 2 family protein [Halomarina halobia]|uniref:Nuclear transport factor 2 family protein n=1 Tax=Halomarina halobia TaxID=3033386 RepID=A0ABD6A4A4_9EURY|nr:nuclear transport factor 2 family protein [Halomarina sp. PSR21]
MDAETTVREYYAALRNGDPLAPFFLDAPSVVKFGLSERLAGYDEIAAGLREQTRTTTDWVVGSSNLAVERRDDAGWFSDDVFLAWTDVDRGVRFEFDTRWSGTLVRDGGWRFAGMHVSTAREGL